MVSLCMEVGPFLTVQVGKALRLGLAWWLSWMDIEHLILSTPWVSFSTPINFFFFSSFFSFNLLRQLATAFLQSPNLPFLLFTRYLPSLPFYHFQRLENDGKHIWEFFFLFSFYFTNMVFEKFLICCWPNENGFSSFLVFSVEIIMVEKYVLIFQIYRFFSSFISFKIF